MAGPALSVSTLTKKYGAVTAVQGATFEVAAGEIFGLIGPNGAGKTTTLECILGLCEFDEGSILVHGIDARKDSDRAKDLIGAQLQGSALPDAMTARQALTLCASFYSKAARPDDLIERFLLGEKADARYASLSAGQRQRLALALAFVNEPQIVILDEPTAGLDPPARRELHELISAQRSAGRTILFSTHYLEEAGSLCDRIALIDHGRLIAVDTPEALVARSRCLPNIVVRTALVLDRGDVETLPGACSCSRDGASWRIETASVNRTLICLGSLIEAKGGELLDLQIHRPALEDAFFELTKKGATEP